MNSTGDHSKRVAVIGGGISGLATAHRLWELAPGTSITLLEQADRMGGVLETVRQDGFLLETGADNFITNVPWAIDLCRRIGFEDQLLETRPTHRTAFVVRRGRLHKIPQGFIVMAPSRLWPIISTPILSPLGKLRLAAECLVRKRKDESDESLADFVTRRLGRETYDRLVQPLIGGIYTGDPKKLSLLATMPRFRELEQKYGSLTRGMLSQASKQRKSENASSGGRYSMFVAPRDGVSSLLDAIAGRLPDGTVQLRTPVQQIKRQANGQWQLTVGSDPPRTMTVDAVVVATQAKVAAKLLADICAPLSENLAEIDHSGCAIVTLAYQRDQIAHPMDGFGYVVPIRENRKTISGSFASVKYPGRAPEGGVLIRVFIGGACQSELLDLTDDQLRQVAVDDLAELMGVRGSPSLVRIVRLPETMPQYYVGHQQRVKEIESQATALGGLFLTGNAYHGVGIPFCIHGGEKTARNVCEYLDNQGRE